MPILRDFERRLGSLVEGFFASTFRSGLQPVELAKRLMREMDTNKTVGVRDVWAPNHFVFTLSEHDAQRFEQAEQALISELRHVVREAAAERGWGLVGQPEIEFEVDETLGRGRFQVRSSFVEGEGELAPRSPGGGRGSLVHLGDGRSFALTDASMTIGRLAECDLVLDDAGASRQHASIRATDAGYLMTDLGSTNGTLVNDQPIQEHLLEDGDRVTIGETVLEFRSG
jgi:hypothetical protein